MIILKTDQILKHVKCGLCTP